MWKDRLRRSLYVSWAALLALSMTGCRGGSGATSHSPEGNHQESVNPDPAHNSRNSLDWPGVYRGILPCADCAGIRTEIRLHADETYASAIQYEGKSDSVYRQSGSFAWDAAGGIVRLEGWERTFRVGENILIQLDADGNRITGDLAPQYFLHKRDGSLAGADWRLFWLEGQPVLPEGLIRQPYLRFGPEQGSMMGHGGCNLLNGSYTIGPAASQIVFGPIASTRMACPDMTVEQRLLGLLQDSLHYRITRDTLEFLDGDHALQARFYGLWFP